MSTFRYLSGSVPTTQRSESEVTARGVSIKIFDKEKLSTSKKLKLSKTARDKGEGTFTLFSSDEKLMSDFQTVYDIHMRIKGFSKALTHFDMQDVFQIIPEDTIQWLRCELDTLFVCQTEEEQATLDLNSNLSDKAFISRSTSAKLATVRATTALGSIDIKNVDLITTFQDLDETEICLSNR